MDSYVAGCVYQMDTLTGKILDRWIAAEPGGREDGHRITTVRVSRDGRFVAAGTGPEGLVFLFAADTGELLRVLRHGGSTILIVSFSPDSRRLASVAAGQIKIWRTSEDNAGAGGARR